MYYDAKVRNIKLDKAINSIAVISIYCLIGKLLSLKIVFDLLTRSF